jgi:PAS domain S-box-containing protein
VRTKSGVMDEPIGFLESELERVVVTMGRAPAEDNVVQISDSLRSQATLRERERRFRGLLDALPAAVYTTDAAGRITYYNDTAAALWGHRPPLGTSEWCGSWKLYWPDGTPLAHDECPMAIALKADRTVRGMEAVAERPDGTRVPFIPYPTPIHDDAGKLIGAVNMLVDITDRKRAEDQQALLVRELHHRVKNTLATVQAIMGSTARTVDNIEDFKTAIFGRIQSLAKTHLLLADDVRAVDFADILRSELDAFDSGIGGRITLQGPEVALTSQIAVSLGMAIHELTTNAAKHGALSVYGGKVEVTWSVTIDATRRTLTFDWVESGGPPVKEPTREGFGSRLLDFVLPGQIQARTRIEYAPEGVRVHCSLPLPAETKN